MGRFLVIALIGSFLAIGFHEPLPALSQVPFPSFFLFRGNLHSHSWLSGDVAIKRNTPESIYRWARLSGYHFWALTDHTDQPCPSLPRASRLSSEDFRAVKQAAEDATVDGLFVAFAGFEWTGTRKAHGDCDLWFSGDVIGVGHMNVLEPNSDEVATASYPLSRQQIYSYLRSLGSGVIQFNHPAIYPATDNFSAFRYEEDVDFRFPSFMEVGTGYYRRSPYSPRQLDRFATERWYRLALSRGWHVGVTNNQDNHTYSWWNPNHTGVWATGLSRDAILTAIRNRRTFASEDPSFKLWFTANDHPMGSTCVPDQNGLIQFRVVLDDFEIESPTDYITQAVIFGGRRFEPSANIRAVVSLLPQEGLQVQVPAPVAFESDSFYYIRVMQKDGDLIFSSPVWTCAAPPPPPSTVIVGAGVGIWNEPMAPFSVDRIRTVVVWQNSPAGQEPEGVMTVRGPAGWNNNAPLTSSTFCAAGSGGTAIIPDDPVTGSYVVEVFCGPGQYGRQTVDVDASNVLPASSMLSITTLTSNSISATWAPVPGARTYELIIRDCALGWPCVPIAISNPLPGDQTSASLVNVPFVVGGGPYYAVVRAENRGYPPPLPPFSIQYNVSITQSDQLTVP